MDLKWEAKVDTWGPDGGWHFVRLPRDTYADLRELASPHKRGFGSIKVRVNIGVTVWETSLFPDSKDKSYILFIKKAVRKAESINLGDIVKTSATILM